MSAAASKEIVNKRGKVSSPVWQFFGYYKSDRSQTNVVCKPWRGTASVPYDKESKRYKDITEAVAYHIAKDMLPLRLYNCYVFIVTLDLCLHFNYLSFPW